MNVDPTDPHLDGLLHMATLAFAMTLVYLGFDRVSDQARERMERALQRQEQAVGEFFSTVEARIGVRKKDDEDNDHVNLLRDHIARWRHRFAICMLLTFGKYKHDIYDGAFGRWLRRWHEFRLLMAYGCYLRRWDVYVIGVAALASGLSFLALTGATTFRYSIPIEWVVVAFGMGTITILLVAASAWHSSSARSWLTRNDRIWRKDFTDWADRLNILILKEAEAIVAKRITAPPPGPNLPPAAAPPNAPMPNQPPGA